MTLVGNCDEHTDWVNQLILDSENQMRTKCLD